MDSRLAYASAAETVRWIRTRQISPVEIMESTLERIRVLNPRLNCFCFVYEHEAHAAARQAEQALMNGSDLGPLFGVPVALKDLTPMKGRITTRGSKVYQDWVPEFDPVIVQRLTQAGAIVVGKTTTPEFAYDSFTQSPLWGTTRNPWNLAHTPGGSSGGSAAAVASGCVSLAEGTDMGGSIRIPASFCGLVGLKPSLGRIPMDILPTVFDDISHFGPLGRTIEDVALFMRVTAGPDEADIMSLPITPNFQVPVARDVRKLRIAVSPDLGYYALDSEVAEGVRRAAVYLENEGAVVEEVATDWTKAINDAWFDCWGVYLDVCFVRDLDRWRNEMDPNVIKLIERARGMSATDYKRVEILRTDLWKSLSKIFERYDALLSATTALPAPELGLSDSDFQRVDGDGRFHGLDMTCLFNFVGQCPAMSVPSGLTSAGLPTGLQIVGRRFDEVTVLRIGAVLEDAIGWPSWRPTGIA